MPGFCITVCWRAASSLSSCCLSALLHISHILLQLLSAPGSALPLLVIFAVQPTEPTILRDQTSVPLGKFQPVTVVLLHSATPAESPQCDLCPSSPQRFCVEDCTVKSTFVYRHFCVPAASSPGPVLPGFYNSVNCSAAGEPSGVQITVIDHAMRQWSH